MNILKNSLLFIAGLLLSFYVVQKVIVNKKAEKFYTQEDFSVCNKILTITTSPVCEKVIVEKNKTVQNEFGFISSIKYLDYNHFCMLNINGEIQRVLKEDFPSINFESLPLGKHCLEFK